MSKHVLLNEAFTNIIFVLPLTHQFNIMAIQKQRVLITDDVHPLFMAGLESAGFGCVYLPNIVDAEVRRLIGDYVGLVINSKINVDAAMLDKAHQLRFVARLGSGMEIVDRPYAAAKGVAVLSSPEGNCNAVAEQAIGMLLALFQNIAIADRQVRDFDWQREANRGRELAKSTVGIIGFGHTGSMFAQKLAGFDVRVLAYDKYLGAGYAAAFDYVTETRIETLLKEADIVSLHLPLTPETKHFLRAETLAKCRDGVVVINTSRGSCINTADLLVALQQGKVAGACLDVFENEKTTTFTDAERDMYTQLYRMQQVILTPHIAGWTHESKARLASILLRKILKLHLTTSKL